MNYLIASDIHGSYYYGKKVIDLFEKHHCDKIILLGDLLYHGPRNDLPKGHDPKALTVLLNQYANKIIAVCGNCDADIDQMVLNFPILAPYFMMEVHQRMLYFTHGHIFNNDHLMALNSNDILVHGHTHVQRIETYPTHTYINPGSISLPKEDSRHAVIILHDNIMDFVDENDEVFLTYTI